MNNFNRELRHAWIKKGEEAENHKYIRREWRNGRWRYWYKKDTLNKNVNTSNTNDFRTNLKTNVDNMRKAVETHIGITARKELQTAKNISDTAKVNLDNTKEKYDIARDRASEDNYITAVERMQVSSSKNLYDMRKKENEKAGKEYVDKLETYMKTPLGKLEKFFVKGKSYVGEILKTMNNKTSEDYDEIKRQARYDEAEQNTEKINKYKASQEKERRDVQKPILQKIKDELDKFNPFPSLKVKTKATTYDEDMAMVNPNYEPGSLYDQNCAVCSMTYDLRRRGYDVTAESELTTLENGTEGLTIYEIARMYDDPNRNIVQKIIDKIDDTTKQLDAVSRIVTISDLSDKYGSSNTINDVLRNVEKEMLSYGDGARGNFGVSWSSAGGHSVVWEVCNGKVVIRDCQVNKTYDLDYYADYIDDCYFIRTDNLIPNDEILKYVKNRR